MFQQLFSFMLEIPQTLANFGQWLVTPLNTRWLNISPLALLGISGTTVIISLIVVHIVKLFI